MKDRQKLGERIVRLLRFLQFGPVDPEKRRRVTMRVDSLLERLRDRLSEKDFQWAVENSGQTEWELAVVTIHEAMRRGELSLSADEAHELAGIEAQIDRRMVREMLKE